MKSLEAWLDEYSVTHQNPVNKKIHKICVPVISLSLLGMLFAIPLPLIPFVPLNGAWLAVCYMLVFYRTFGQSVLLIMLAVLAGAMGAIYLLNSLFSFYFYLGLFILGWIGQAIGHHLEGKRPAFFQDLSFLLIGPLWIFYRR